MGLRTRCDCVIDFANGLRFKSTTIYDIGWQRRNRLEHYYLDQGNKKQDAVNVCSRQSASHARVLFSGLQCFRQNERRRLELELTRRGDPDFDCELESGTSMIVQRLLSSKPFSACCRQNLTVAS